MYTVYILECADGSLYTGITTDLKRRMEEHALGTASRYTKAKKFLRLRYWENQSDRSQASQREYAIKQLSRAEKFALIASAEQSSRDNS